MLFCYPVYVIEQIGVFHELLIIVQKELIHTKILKVTILPSNLPHISLVIQKIIMINGIINCQLPYPFLGLLLSASLLLPTFLWLTCPIERSFIFPIVSFSMKIMILQFHRNYQASFGYPFLLISAPQNLLAFYSNPGSFYTQAFSLGFVYPQKAD